MENNYDNTPKENDGLTPSADNSNTGQPSADAAAGQQPVKASDTAGQYTDPNAGVQPDHSQQYPYTSQNAYNSNQQNNGYQYGQQDINSQNSGYNYGQNYNQNQNQNYNQNYNSNYNQNNSYNYQDNYNYNTGNQYNQMYEGGQDMSPMTMGDWLLTLLVAMIPCFGIIIYFVWAFSKTTNINRRNFCRAQLVIIGVVLVIYIIFFMLFGSMLFSMGNFYY
ncbi:MAG: hypothetical protein HFG82_07395 [Dorea sp.]|nr:hypothetical protein [Dorea sp.]GFI43256.1 hypothetical protein IMSAGC018_00924 [Lachnospiraceae bacterium]